MANLTGKNISDTYTRLVQVSESQLYDGAGGILPIQFDSENVIISGTLTAQTYVVSESIVNVSSGSTIFGNSSDDTHTFTGNITASNITASNLDLSDHINFKDTSAQIAANGDTMLTFQPLGQQIIAAANIRSGDGKGIKFGVNSDYHIKHNSTATNDTKLAIAEGLTTRYTFGVGGHLTASTGVNIKTSNGGEFRGLSANITNITASAISASTIAGAGSGDTQLNVRGQITASGNISASGNIVADYYDATTSGTGYKLDGVKVVYIDSTKYHFGRQSAGTVISGSTIELGKESTTHVTASGNISSSGTINANILSLRNQTFADYDGSTYFRVATSQQMAVLNNLTVAADPGDVAGVRISTAGHITASGNISASGNIIGNEIQTHTIDTAPGAGSIAINSGVYQNGFLTVQDGQTFRANGNVELGSAITDTIEIDGHITASGTISASEYKGQTVSLVTHAFSIIRSSISPTFAAGHMVSGNKSWAWSDRAWVGNFMFHPRDGNMAAHSQSHCVIMPFDVQNLTATVAYSSNKGNTGGGVSGSFYLFKRIPSGATENSSSVTLDAVGVNSIDFDGHNTGYRRYPTFDVSSSALLPGGNTNPISMSKGDELYFFYSDNTGLTTGAARANFTITAEKV